MIAPRISRLELIAAGVTLFMLAEAFLPRLLAPPSTGIPGDVPESTLLRFLWLPFYALIGLGLILVARESWRAVLRSPWLVLLAVLAIVSATWSIDPELSFRRGIAVLATTLMGYALASPDTIRGRPHPAIVCNPAAGLRAFANIIQQLTAIP